MNGIRLVIAAPWRLIGSLMIMVILGAYGQWDNVGWFFAGTIIWSVHLRQ